MDVFLCGGPGWAKAVRRWEIAGRRSECGVVVLFGVVVVPCALVRVAWSGV